MSPLKKEYEPQLATLTKFPPHGPEWVHEAKFDGYRTGGIKDGDNIKFITRNGHDWTKVYSKLVSEFQKIPAKQVELDGEVVALDEKGIPDFNKLQNSIGSKKRKENVSGLVFYAFDILSLNGRDLRQKRLIDRKKILQDLFKKKFSKNILYSEHFETDDPEALVNQMCKLRLEGVVSKRVDAPYIGGRNKNWLKCKCSKTEEFIIIGYRTGTEHEIGSLLLGSYENGELKFQGKVGTGLSKKTKDLLNNKFKPLITKRPTIAEAMKYEYIVWLRPSLVAEVEFLDKTSDGLRHASFSRLRPDKNIEEVTKAPSSKKKSNGMVFPEVKVTRNDLKAYYQKISSLILPYIKHRPLNLYICYGGIKGKCAFYRRAEAEDIPHVHFTAKSKGHYWMDIKSKKGLESILNLSAVEIHSWGSRVPEIDNPDMIVMDIDASETVSLDEIRESARVLKRLFDDLGLESFIKTTGGKGYHIHVPILPIYSWDQIHNFCYSVAKMMAESSPDLYTASTSLQKRKGKIFIDYLRNHSGATSVAPYSLRAKSKATIAVPISWKDLDKISPDDFTIKDSDSLLKRKDPWASITKLKQKIPIFD